MPATDWVTISALATAGGTLVLAAATFASVRSANRAARVAERSLLAGLRPLLVPSKFDDPPQKVGFADDKWVVAEGGRGVAEVGDSAIYLVIPLRNVGAGIWSAAAVEARLEALMIMNEPGLMFVVASDPFTMAPAPLAICGAAAP